MVRGEYQKSLDTLRDGLSLMQSIVRPASTAAEECIVSVADQERNQVHRTAQRLACLAPEQQLSKHGQIDVVCYDGSIDPQFLQHGAFKALAILINDVCDTEDIHEMVHSISPAIMFSNYALAHLCFSKGDDICGIFDGVTRLLGMAHQILDIEGKFTTDRLLQVKEGDLFVAIAILNNIGCVHRETGRLADLAASLEELALLKCVANELTEQTCVFAACAAAA